MSSPIHVAILDDHQSIVDGYLFRLSREPEIEVAATLAYGEQLEALISEQPVDVLLLDVSVPTSPDNRNAYPILHTIPSLLQRYPRLVVLVISMHAERALIRSVMEVGASGYILKDDGPAIRELAAIIKSVAHGGIYLSQQAHEALQKGTGPAAEPELTPRQLEVLSMMVAYPDNSSAELAAQLGVSTSTIRNLASSAYLRLGVRTRIAAIARARQLGLLPA
jgi:two-component system nitrate/nitrite response regulator NarL